MARRGIDHLVLCVTDLDEAVAFYQRLGFTTTPRAEHPWGTDNSLVQLDGCFLELLCVARPQRIESPAPGQFGFGAFSRDFLAEREGLSMLVFESSDAHADRAEFIARRLDTFEVFDFGREATLPDGARVRVAFSLAFAVDARMPDIAFFCCQQHAPEHFWKPHFQAHANGASVIDEVLMAAPEPGVVADFFERIQEPDSVRETDGDLLVTTPRGRIRILSPAAAGARLEGFASATSPVFAGFTVRIPDVDRTASDLRAADVPFERRGQRLVIPTARAHGVQIELTA